MSALLIATPAAHGLAEALRPGLGGAALLTIGEQETRSSLSQRLAELVAAGRKIDLVVLALLPQDAVVPRAVTETAPTLWQASCMTALKLTLHVIQALHDALAPQGGTTIVVLGPYFAQSGAAMLVPLTTLAEGQRGLVKASARQLAAAGFRIHWAGLGASVFHPALGDVKLPRKADEISVALGEAPTAETIAPILTLLASDAARKGLTGTTLMLDGGEWMVP